MGTLALFAILGCINFYNAYSQMTSEGKRKSMLSRTTLTKDNQIKGSFRKYKSAEGYLKYMFIQSIIGGTLLVVYGLLTYFVKNIDLAALLIFIAAIMITDIIIYKRCSSI